MYGKWLSTNKNVADKKVLICTNATEIKCMGKYPLKFMVCKSVHLHTFK